MSRPPGRPRTRPDDAPFEYAGFRLPVELKSRIVEAAKSNNRSLSTEMQFRIEQSFNEDRLLERIELMEARLLNHILEIRVSLAA